MIWRPNKAHLYRQHKIKFGTGVMCTQYTHFRDNQFFFFKKVSFMLEVLRKVYIFIWLDLNLRKTRYNYKYKFDFIPTWSRFDTEIFSSVCFQCFLQQSLRSHISREVRFLFFTNGTCRLNFFKFPFIYFLQAKEHCFY